jgi:hypothetical protein
LTNITIFNYTKTSDPVIDINFFTNIPAVPFYWSSTTIKQNITKAITVYFSIGGGVSSMLGSFDKTNSNRNAASCGIYFYAYFVAKQTEISTPDVSIFEP